MPGPEWEYVSALMDEALDKAEQAAAKTPGDWDAVLVFHPGLSGQLCLVNTGRRPVTIRSWESDLEMLNALRDYVED